jgi:MFS family permease
VLLGRYLGASEFHIGLLSAIPPATVALQLFMTNVIDRIGYREMMLLGWGTRSFMLLLVAPLPFLVGHVPSQWLVWALLLALTAFNVIRGLASGAWLPWLRGLLPESQRGTYFGLEQRVMNLSGFVTLLGCGWFLGDEAAGWKYCVLFLIAWAVGMASVAYLRRAPSLPPERRDSGARPLKEVLRLARIIWKHKPFRRITRFVGVLNIALTPVPAFLVLYVREDLGWPEGQVLKLQAASTLGVLLTAVFWGRLSDRAGSRPLLALGLTAQLLIAAWWMMTALSIIHPTFWLGIIAYFFYGVAAAAMAVSQMRLVLGSSPSGETTISMAVYQVIVALCAGVSPVVWGAVLDVMRKSSWTQNLQYSLPFAIFFSTCITIGIVAHVLLSKVTEERAVRAHQLVVQAIYDWPVKVVSGVVLRGRR